MAERQGFELRIARNLMQLAKAGSNYRSRLQHIEAVSDGYLTA